MADRFNMSDVMISYARRHKTLARRIEQALRDDGLEVWIDWEDIPPIADWWQEIQAGIDGSHTIIFLITPASVRSEVCKREIEHAIQQHKRIVPIIQIELSDEDKTHLHPALSAHNWLFFREADDFQQAYDKLREALNTDLEYKKEHTRLLVRSHEWVDKNQSGSFLLRGDDLRQAENWLLHAMTGQTPQPTQQQIEYIRASSRAARQWTQRLVGAGMIALLLIVSGLMFALTQSQRASAETQRALTEGQLRLTQEWLANVGLADAATAQEVANDSAIAAATAQAQVLLAQTAEKQALEDSANSQTQAFVAQQSALTATVLQGEANELASTAQVQQQTAEAARNQAQQQAQQAQQQAGQAQEQAQRAQQEADALATAAATMMWSVQQTLDTQRTLSAEQLAVARTRTAHAQATIDTVEVTNAALMREIQPMLDEANATGTEAAREMATAVMAVTNAQGELGSVQQQGTQQSLNLTAQVNAERAQIAEDNLEFNSLYAAITQTAAFVATAKSCIQTTAC